MQVFFVFFFCCTLWYLMVSYGITGGGACAARAHPLDPPLGIKHPEGQTFGKIR